MYHDGLTVISGDSSGYLKTWDMRMGKVLQAILNEPTKKPISHLAVSKQRGSLDGVSLAETEEPESRWLAVNSYDNGKQFFLVVSRWMWTQAFGSVW